MRKGCGIALVAGGNLGIARLHFGLLGSNPGGNYPLAGRSRWILAATL
jgi:hypothetical protein